MHAYNPSTWEVQARELKVQGYAQLYNSMKLDYMRPYLKKRKREKRNIRELQSDSSCGLFTEYTGKYYSKCVVKLFTHLSRIVCHK